MQAPIILLKEGTDTSQGKAQLISNINSCQAIAALVRSTLGPRGMDKLIVDAKGKATISNDGATIMSLLDIVHPAAQTLVDIAQSQDAEVGDGTTTVVLFAAELLEQSKQFIEEGVHTRLLIRAFRSALQMCIQRIKEIEVHINKTNQQEWHQLLERCAATSLSSKLVASNKEFFTKIVVDAVLSLDETLPLDMIGIKKVPGGAMDESMLVRGVAFQKTFTYAGFEMQPKKYVNPKICLLNVELELKAERDNAEIRIDSVEEYQKVVEAEWQILYQKLEKIVDSGATVVLSRLPIGDIATQYFADRDIFCAGRVSDDDIRRTVAACGGSIQTSVNSLTDSVLGNCGLFEERQVGSERFNFFVECPGSKTVTLILRGGAKQFIEESARSLHDAIMVVRRVIQNDAVVAGGGAIEMNLSWNLKKISSTMPNKGQLFVQAFAKALEVIPFQLCENAGFDSNDIMNRLRARHFSGELWYGVDISKEDVSDNMANLVWEPSMSKIHSLTAATEAACMILSVDETVKNAASQDVKGQTRGMNGPLGAM